MHAVVVTVVPPPVATSRYAVIATPPVKPGGTKPTVIACDEADAEVRVGAVANAGRIWNARVTLEAAAYWLSPGCEATTSHVPTARIVTLPSGVTEHAEFVVPAPREYSTVRPEDAVAPSANPAAPKDLFDG